MASFSIAYNLNSLCVTAHDLQNNYVQAFLRKTSDTSGSYSSVSYQTVADRAISDYSNLTPDTSYTINVRYNSTTGDTSVSGWVWLGSKTFTTPSDGERCTFNVSLTHTTSTGVTYGTFKLPPSTPTKDGYIFSGWKSSSSLYAAGDWVSMTTSGSLTAVWGSGADSYVWINIDGTSTGWKQAIPYINIDGTSTGWKQAIPYINIDGTSKGWKQCV